MKTTTQTTGSIFDSITVNVATGAISYPKVEGFVLDVERVYSTAALFAPHCASVEMAIRQAIHGQISAHIGASQLFAR